MRFSGLTTVVLVRSSEEIAGGGVEILSEIVLACGETSAIEAISGPSGLVF